MRKATLILGLLALLAGCSTMQMERQTPDRIYHSNKPRDVVAECLMNRLAGNEFRIDRRDIDGQTLVSASQGLTGITYFLFGIRDTSTGGSNVELRRANSIAPGLHNAETCF